MENFANIEAGRRLNLNAKIWVDLPRFTGESGTFTKEQLLTACRYRGPFEDVSMTTEGTIPTNAKFVVLSKGDRDDNRNGVFFWRSDEQVVIRQADNMIPTFFDSVRGLCRLPGEPHPRDLGTDSGESRKTAPAAKTATGGADDLVAAIQRIAGGAVDETAVRRIASEVVKTALDGFHGGTAKVAVQINGQETKTFDGVAHKLLPEMLQWAGSIRRNGLRYNIALIGDAGTGKSTLAAQTAKALDLRFGYLNCSGGVGESRLLGRMTPNISDGTEHYTSTPLVDFYTNGGVFCLDEMDGLDSNVLLSLNGMIENGFWTRPDGQTVERHRDFLAVATMNTFGTGASRIFTGRSQLDGSSLDRWKQLECDYDNGLEIALCGVKGLAERIHQVRAAMRKLGLRRWVTGRAIERCETAIACHGATIDAALRAEFASWTDADRTAVGIK